MLGAPSSTTPPDPALLYQQAGLMGQAFTHPKRLQILVLLSQRDRTVGDLAELMRLSVASLSAHLQNLKKASLVVAERDGKHIWYRLSDPSVYELVSSLMATSRRLGPEAREIHQAYLESPETLEEATPASLADDLDAGRITLLDLRPADEYHAGHLPSARSLPFTELVERLDELPRRRRLVGYCRGPFCLSAIGAIRAAGGRGRSIKRLPFGVNEWRAAGLELKRAEA